MTKLKRIIIVGTSGSGKSTLARQLAQKLKITHIELDACFWQENWTPASDSHLQDTVSEAMIIADRGWVIDGNYSRLRELTWTQADTIICLDYSFPVIYWRIITRTLKRVVTRKKLWNGNRETFRDAFLSKDSIIWWAHITHLKNREQYERLFQSDDYPHLNYNRFKTPRETEIWLNSLPAVP